MKTRLVEFTRIGSHIRTDIMIRSKYVTLAATAALSLGMFSVLSGHSITSAVEIDGVRYEGSVQGSNVVVADFPVRQNGIDVTAVEGRQVDVLFEPVQLAVGERFTATGRDSEGAELATITLEQTGANTTDVVLSLAPVMNRLKSDQVTLRARSASGDITEFQVPAAASIKVGEVLSTSGAWAKTYHLVCIDGECCLAVDPDETEVAFEADPTQSVPFQFLEVDFSIHE